MKRRTFLCAAATGFPVLARAQSSNVPEAIRNLRPMTGGIQPITGEERRARIEKARKLMQENKIGAVVMESGSSMFYFTGIRGPAGDRTFALVLAAVGEPVWIVPAADETRVSGDVRGWAETEGPYKKLAQALKDRGAATGRVGIEERTRFAVFDGIRKEAPALEFTSADPVTAGCRVIKSPAEIALMQRANDIT
ncbi:MAG TPA: aminopeptidase P family N-terminal domain-containing protein, partial [Bryobacteraceae bacterium]|nr:aminopeptidase P family N-terminal domain-containing protein [Bryobacteraceae bacterium]